MAILITGFLLLQTEFAKDKIARLVFSLAEEAGIELKIDHIEGNLPFKWTLSGVHIKTQEGDSLDIDQAQIRIAIFPLLKKEIAISYAACDSAKLSYSLKSRPIELKPLIWTLSVRSLQVNHLMIENRESHQAQEFSLHATSKFKRKDGGFFVSGRLTGASGYVQVALRQKSGTIHAQISADIESKEAFMPLVSFPYDMSLSLKGEASGSLDKQLSGCIEADIRNLWQLKNMQTEGRFILYPDKSVIFPSLTLKSNLLCIKGKTSRDGFLFDILLPQLSYFNPNVSGSLTGHIQQDGENFTSHFSSTELHVGAATYPEVKGVILASKINHSWDGDVKIDAEHETLPLHFLAGLRFEPGKEVSLTGGQLVMNNAKGALDTTINLADRSITGGGLLQVSDLSPFNIFLPEKKIAGELGLKFSLLDETLHFFVKGTHLQFDDYLAQEFIISGQMSESLKGKLQLAVKTAYLGPALCDDLSLETYSEADETWPFSIKASGTWTEAFNIDLKGAWKKEFLKIDAFSGLLLNQKIASRKPFSIASSPDSLKVTEWHLTFNDGYAKGSLDLNPESASCMFKAELLPLDLISMATARMNLSGQASVDLSLSGNRDNLQGRINLVLQKGDILPAGKKVPIHSKGIFQANIDHGIIQLHTHLTASNEQFLEFESTLPLDYQLYPLKIGLKKEAPIAASLAMEGHLEDIFDFINVGSQRLEGLVSTRLVLSHTLAEPHLAGSLSIQDGLYENYIIGLYIQKIEAQSTAKGQTLNVSSLTATDAGHGQLQGTGHVQLSDSIPFFLDANVEGFKILDLGWLSSSFTGPVKLFGDRSGATVEGDLIVSRADVEIPNELPSDLPVLPIVFENRPAHLEGQETTFEPSYPFLYNANVTANEDIFLKGRGLDAELSGKLHIGGQNLAVKLSGGLLLVKGKFTFGGQTFNLTTGELTFTEAPSSYLNISGALSLSDLTVIAELRGPLTSPNLSFQSNPPLPTSSILARILFNKDVSELSEFQAIQLADAIITLSGNAGPNVLQTIRDSLGVDRINITTESTGGISVQIGKYLTEGVLITLAQGTQSSQVIVEVALKGGFILQAETQADEQGKFSLKWNKNY